MVLAPHFASVLQFALRSV